METTAASSPSLAKAAPSPAFLPRHPMEKPSSLQQVFAAEESPLLRYAYGLVGQRETAEDLVQEVFLRLHAHWDEVANPRAWLFRSVHNLALNHLRDRHHETTLDNHPEPATTDPDAENALGRMETIGTLQLLIAELPSTDRQLIHLKYHRKLKYEQISQQTGLSVGNVGYKLHNLLKHLADSLRRLGIESADG